eukprot:6806417-Pyramimonas_sp.AAC.1
MAEKARMQGYPLEGCPSLLVSPLRRRSRLPSRSVPSPSSAPPRTSPCGSCKRSQSQAEACLPRRFGLSASRAAGTGSGRRRGCGLSTARHGSRNGGPAERTARSRAPLCMTRRRPS